MSVVGRVISHECTYLYVYATLCGVISYFKITAVILVLDVNTFWTRSLKISKQNKKVLDRK
jgi:hypothetical protein